MAHPVYKINNVEIVLHELTDPDPIYVEFEDDQPFDNGGIAEALMNKLPEERLSAEGIQNQLEKLEGSINEIFQIIEDKNLDPEDKKCKCEGEYKFNCSEACSPNGISFLVEGLEKSDFGLSLGSSDYQRSREANGKFKQ
uniref:Uncharacterized protein n=1 Tax=Meloidogyne incognita TaxID=6306 RepID=A0A914LVE6_MELIC